MTDFAKGQELFDKLDKWFKDFVDHGECEPLVYNGTPLGLHIAAATDRGFRVPTSIRGIQALSKKLETEFRIKHTDGLHLAARRAGYADWPDAKRKLERKETGK